ncbi:MAG: sugar phosphate isomerase/epimerase [Clostridiaceae bacterium]|nr:sugar phosphate isomerase/epimerase [Clostridiaceae bacterium]
MIKTGLVSVTFRNLSPEEIIELVKKAGLDGIEWGGDIHVPHGKVEIAKDVAKKTREAGLNVASYGSYYSLGCEKEKNLPFEKVLESALALEAPVIRVWAGRVASEKADEAYWDMAIEESGRIADMAMKHGIKIAYEYHPNTLTDTCESAYKLLKEVGHSNVFTYWQRPFELNTEECIESIVKISPWLTNINAYYYENRVRMPLSKGLNEWKEFIETFRKIDGDRYVMIEFVVDNSPEQFLEDAKALKEVVG